VSLQAEREESSARLLPAKNVGLHKKLQLDTRASPALDLKTFCATS